MTDAAATDDLSRCIRDLVALSSLPEIWKTFDPPQITESLASALVSMLDAAFVCISLNQDHAEPILVAALPEGAAGENNVRAVAESVAGASPEGPRGSPAIVANPFGPGSLRAISAAIGFGTRAEIHVASSRADFPSRNHQLLLGVAANHAAIALRRWETERSHRRFATLVENSSDFIGVAALDGAPLYVNAAGLRMVGLASLEDLPEGHFLSFVPAEDRPFIRDQLWPYVMETGRWVGEMRLSLHDRPGVVPILVDWFRIDDPRTGAPISLATVSRDLTSQKRSEAAMRELNESLEERVSLRTKQLLEANAKLRAEVAERRRVDARLRQLQAELFHAARLSTAGQMAATLAHELTQPLTAATNSINAVRRLLARDAGEQTINTAAEILLEASAQTLRAGQIIHSLRNFVSEQALLKQAEEVATMVEEASALAGTGDVADGVEVRFDLDTALSPVLANRVQIQQVLVNLMRNAREAMANSDRRILTIGAAPADDGCIEIVVADTGPGLPREIADNLYAPFVTTKPTGMGLGLSICQSIVEAHGGVLRFEPSEEGGARFAFTLASAGGGAGSHVD